MGALRALPPTLELARRLARFAHRHDLIYANTQKAMIVAALAGKLANKPVIWHLRDILSSAHSAVSSCGQRRGWPID